MDKRIVIFDGHCNFCSRAVLFIIRRDKKGHFAFAASQTQEGKKILDRYQVGELARHSMILVEQGMVHRKSTAALRIARKLRGGWRLFYVFMVIPRRLRDFMYDQMARNRYRLFGMRDQCFVPAPEMRDRFLSG
jgi:predicted DCC family thiol-disulfide oxidoreductase YuxK